MASIKKIMSEVQYELTLSKREAEILAVVLSLVGGHPDTNRKHIAAILGALTNAGVYWGDVEADVSGNVIIKD